MLYGLAHSLATCQGGMCNLGANRAAIRDMVARTMSDQDRRLAVSLGLKAARWLAGTANDGHAVPLTTTQLAARQPLVDNGIRKSRLEDFEQMRATARPMELDQISLATGLDVPGLIRLAQALLDPELGAVHDALDQIPDLPPAPAGVRTQRDVRR